MRGNPLIEWFGVVVCWCVLLVPLILITQSKPVVAHSGHDHSHHDHSHHVEENALHSNAAVSNAQASLETWSMLRFSHKPKSVKVFQGETMIFESQKVEANLLEFKAPLNFNDKATSLLLMVEWPEEVGSFAVEYSLEPNGLARRSSQYWFDRNGSKIMDFQW